MNVEVSKGIEAIKREKIQGAGWLSREALKVLGLAARTSQARERDELLAELKEVARELANARPSMAPIANSVARLFYECSNLAEPDLHSLREFAQRRALELAQALEQAAFRAAEQAAKLIEEGDRVMTCSYSSVLLQALRKGRGEKSFEILIAESKVDEKYGELLARELTLAGIQPQVIPDKEIEHYASQASRALTGADSVIADGTVINGSPTYRLALAASRRGIPFHAVCELNKFSPQSPRLERGFDEIPPTLVSGIITEVGLIRTDEVNRQMAEIRKHLRALRG